MNVAGPYSSGEVLGLCLVDDTANQDSKARVEGLVVAVYVDPVCACLSAPTITITTKGAPVETILVAVTDVAGWYYPRTVIHLNTTGAVVANNYSQGIPIHDFVNVKIEDAAVGDYANVWLLLE